MIKIDPDNHQVIDKEGNVHPMDSPEAFELVSKAWIRCGWDTKYVYSFSWLGRPIIQLPDDMFRIQEIVTRLKPDLIIETGIAHGGSLIFYAGLCKMLDKGRVVGVDIEIRPHNRQAIETHFLFPYITLIEGSSIDPQIIERVEQEASLAKTILVLLDACHKKEHVAAELEAYAPLVSIGSYIVAMDGIMEQLGNAPRTQPDWAWNNPQRAALEFVERHPNFKIEEPLFPFNEGKVTKRVTYWPNAFIKRIS